MDIIGGEELDPRDAINTHLLTSDRSIGWLANKTNSSRSHIHRVLRKERSLPDKLLLKINEALGTNFEKLKN